MFFIRCWLQIYIHSVQVDEIEQEMEEQKNVLIPNKSEIVHRQNTGIYIIYTGNEHKKLKNKATEGNLKK